MAKRSAGTGMTRAEKIWGGALLAVYFAVLPVAAAPLFDLLEKLFGTAIGGGARDAAYYCVLFGLTLAVFWRYWGRTTRAFLDHIGSVLGTVGLGLIAFYGLNELTWRVLRLIPGERVNLNDQAILARIGSAPHSTILIVVFLAPMVEEAVFRGYVFGNLREYSRWGAYLFSCVLFALVHVWRFVTGWHELGYLLLAVQYAAPGLVLAWTFERSGSLWGSILLHGIINGLSVWSVM